MRRRRADADLAGATGVRRGRARARPRPGRQPRRRRHHAAHRRPGGRRACRCSASTSASSATSPRSSRRSLEQALDRFLAGDYAIEERMLLDGRRSSRPTGAEALRALNEAVVEKTPIGHTVRLDGHHRRRVFTTYAADGLIVATPTGLDGVLPLGPRADRGAPTSAPSCSRRCRRTCCSTARSCSSAEHRGSGSTVCGAPARHAVGRRPEPRRARARATPSCAPRRAPDRPARHVRRPRLPPHPKAKFGLNDR